TGGHRPPPARRTFSSGQRALLWAAGVLGALAIIIAVLLVISHGENQPSSPAPTVTDTGSPPAGPPPSKTPSGFAPRLDRNQGLNWTDPAQAGNYSERRSMSRVVPLTPPRTSPVRHETPQ
ncbi:MAG: serine/threonine protein kinase, partial [Mycobacterium sp.]